MVQLRFKTAPNIEDIRSGLKSIGMGDSTIQEFGSKTDILIRVKKSEKELKAIGVQVKESLKDKFNIDEIDVDRVEMVGPTSASDLREKAHSGDSVRDHWHRSFIFPGGSNCNMLSPLSSLLFMTFLSLWVRSPSRIKNLRWLSLRRF